MTVSKYELKEKARGLRKQGITYTQMEKDLKVKRGTLHYWCRDVLLSEEQIEKIVQNSRDHRAKGRCIIAKRNKQERIERRAKCMQEGRDLVNTLTNRELMLVGTALYWGEGGKTKSVTCHNSDASMIRLFQRWLSECFDVPYSKMSIMLHLFEDMDKEEQEEYWRGATGLPKEQFYKTQVLKGRKLTGRIHKMKHGTCAIYVHDVNLFYQIEGMIEQLGNNT